MKITFAIGLIITFASCKTILINKVLKDPVVETFSTIKVFQLKNNYSTENSFIIKGDTASAFEKLFLGMTVGYYVFDKNGDQVCYNGAETCHGSQFRRLLENQTDSFRLCDTKKVNLESVLKQTYDLDGNEVTLGEIEQADYYVVIYWQKFLGGKKGYREAVTWMEEEISKTKSGKKFSVIKINTDLQDTWGLIAGRKAKLVWKKNGSSMTINIQNLPIKR